MSVGATVTDVIQFFLKLGYTVRCRFHNVFCKALIKLSQTLLLVLCQEETLLFEIINWIEYQRGQSCHSGLTATRSSCSFHVFFFVLDLSK